MVITLFINWWYGAGWKNAFARIGQRIDTIAAELSMGILLRTLFEPWKQITSYANASASLESKLRTGFDNVFARVFGFIIRLNVLLFGCVACCLAAIFGIALAIAWPVVPLVPVVFIILTVIYS